MAECAYPHPHPEHPCGQPSERPGEPCRFCGKPVPLNGGSCPDCWTSLEDMPLADIKALFAEAAPDLHLVIKEGRGDD